MSPAAASRTLRFDFCDSTTNKDCYSYAIDFINLYMQVVVTLWTNVIITVLYSSIVYYKPNIVKDNCARINVLKMELAQQMYLK
jgi:hypothetical protein